MKKVLILQNKGKIYGGVWQVNKLVGEALIKKGYDVSIVSIRDEQTNLTIEHDSKLKVFTINEKDIWYTYKGYEIIEKIKQFHILKAIKMTISRIIHDVVIKKDIKKLKNYIYESQPDYIITSHYQLLDMIPKDFLKKTIHQQHSSFKDAINHKKTRDTFDKYNGEIKFLWLTKNTMNSAINYGLTNNAYIYNAVRFKNSDIAEVEKNKKLITIARLSDEKRLDIMIDIVKNIFEDNELKDWKLEIYGSGEEEEKLRNQIANHKQIKLMGLTNDPQKELLNSSINLNTSPSEGFSLSILEANECGIPTVAFNFGESAEEQIIDEKTGIIAKNVDEYTKKLKELMKDNQKLKKLSINCKKYSDNFQIEKIVNDWIKLFKEIEKSK